MSKLEWDKDFINKVICGDCLEVMKQIPDGAVDLVLTDPPYIQDSHGGGGGFGVRMRDYHKGVDSLGKGFDLTVLPSMAGLLSKVNMYIFCSLKQLIRILEFSESYNYNVLTYIKTNPTPTCNNKYLSDTEYIVFVREKGVPLFGSYKTKKKYFLMENGKSIYPHPTVKPLSIIKTLIENSSKPNDIVLDPFLGSGTTAVACKQLGRRFIGIEINEKYCKIAEDRLKQEELF